MASSKFATRPHRQLAPATCKKPIPPIIPCPIIPSSDLPDLLPWHMQVAINHPFEPLNFFDAGLLPRVEERTWSIIKLAPPPPIGPVAATQMIIALALAGDSEFFSMAWQVHILGWPFSDSGGDTGLYCGGLPLFIQLGPMQPSTYPGSIVWGTP